MFQAAPHPKCKQNISCRSYSYPKFLFIFTESQNFLISLPLDVNYQTHEHVKLPDEYTYTSQVAFFRGKTAYKTQLAGLNVCNDWQI